MLAGTVWLGLSLVASDGVADLPVLSLPTDLPAAERSRLIRVAETASVATQVEGEPFPARPDVFEYLLDHPAFASHVSGALRFARLRIWPTAAGLFLDEGYGTTGWFWVVYAADGTRVIYARGQHQLPLLPTIHGEAVVVIDYHYAAGAPGRKVVKTAVAGFVKLDSRILGAALKLGSGIAKRKADREARGLVKLFAKVTRAIEADPAGVYARLREWRDVPQAELEEFRKLLGVP
jgi:hypothetical protein